MEEDTKSPRLKVQGSNPPKKPLSGYMIFTIEKRDGVLAENPHFKVTEVTKYLAQAWNLLTDAQKDPYHLKAL